MAVNENGTLLDDAGRVAVDFVWGNIPLQPNDVRLENGGGHRDADSGSATRARAVACQSASGQRASIVRF